MNTPNLDAILDACCVHSIPGQRRRGEAARAELDALRAAPPIDGVPTEEGWYWCRSATWPKNSGWQIVNVAKGDQELSGMDFVVYTTESGGWSYVREFTDYHGPLTPPKETP